MGNLYVLKINLYDLFVESFVYTNMGTWVFVLYFVLQSKS